MNIWTKWFLLPKILQHKITDALLVYNIMATKQVLKIYVASSKTYIIQWQAVPLEPKTSRKCPEIAFSIFVYLINASF